MADNNGATTDYSVIANILQSTINGTEYTGSADSRIAQLLLQLKAIIEQGGGGGASSLVDLDDVSIYQPTNGQVLKYIAAQNKWQNATDEGKTPLVKTGTLQAGSFGLGWEDANIKANSNFMCFTSILGVNPIAVTLIDGRCFVSFPEQETAMTVEVWLYERS